MKISHHRCQLCKRKSNRLTEGIIMADVKGLMCPTCFCKLKNNVTFRGQLLQKTLPEYRAMVQQRAQEEAQRGFDKEFRKARLDVARVLGG